MATLAEMRTQVLEEGGFDVAPSVVDGWLHDRYRFMVARSRWLLESVAIGPTVAGIAEYTIPIESRVVDIQGLTVGGTPYDRGNWRDIWNLKAGTARLSGIAGLFAGDYSSSGTKRLELYPAPASAGQAIEALAALRPVDLADGDEPIVPEDFHPAIVAGAIATGLMRIDERAADAAPFEQTFQNEVGELTRLGRRRIGNGPTRMRLGR